jgi:hypothetical protein
MLRIELSAIQRNLSAFGLKSCQVVHTSDKNKVLRGIPIQVLMLFCAMPMLPASTKIFAPCSRQSVVDITQTVKECRRPATWGSAVLAVVN